MRRRSAIAVLLPALVAAPALAAPQLRLTPGVSVGAGLDDDVLFDNKGGDGVGETTAQLDWVAFDRLWRVSANLRATGLGFYVRQKGVLLGEAKLGASDRLGRRIRLYANGRLRAADDPLALAQVGLLAGRGRTLGFRSRAGVESLLSRRWTLDTRVELEGVEFIDQSTEPGGEAAGLALTPSYQLTRAVALVPAAEGRLFFTSAGLLARTLDVLAGVRWRLARRTFVEASAGPLAYGDAQGMLWLGVARLRFWKAWRFSGLELDAAHDLTVPSGRGGVLAGELVEAVGRYGDRDWELRARVGYYRSHPSPRDTTWVPGYGLEGGAFRRLFAGVWLGVTALRFERLPVAGEAALARDAAYVNLDWTGGRP